MLITLLMCCHLITGQPQVNIAKGKQVVAGVPTSAASSIVDGLTSTCAQTTTPTHNLTRSLPWFSVDLGADLVVASVHITSNSEYSQAVACNNSNMLQVVLPLNCTNLHD
jgi:hypothetical protein